MLIVPVIAVFVGVFLLAGSAVGIAMLVMQRQQRETNTVEAGASVGDAPGIFKLEEFSSISIWDKLLARFEFVEGMRARIVQSGLNWSVGRVTAMMLLIGSFAMVVLASISWLPGWVARARKSSASGNWSSNCAKRLARRLMT